MATVPPLSLSTVKQRYPCLFQQYTYLSERAGDVEDDLAEVMAMTGQSSKIDPATGLHAIIMGNDFTAPLEDTRGCPMTLDSDANKFAMFLWKMLSASESGSVGGDACRQFDALYAALEDARNPSAAELTGNKAKFEHLLGWTAAVANHGIDALLGRGDPDRNRSLFKAVGDEWKKVFEANEKTSFVSEDLRSFADWQCGYFQQVLKHARKEYGDHARYTFNFGKKPRPVKNAAPARMVPAAAAAATPVPVAAGPSVPSSTTIAIHKSSKDSKIGIAIGQEGNKVKVTSITPDSLFLGKGLQVGMVIDSINGRQFATWPEALGFIQSSEGDLTFVFSTTSSMLVEVYDGTGPWDEEGWVPVTKSGKQKSPNVIRSELQKYIDQCKADRSKTQTSIIEDMGVNNNTFRRFMNPKTYKDQWSAVQNGTYWAAARLLAKVGFENEMAKKAAKRKTEAGGGNARKKAKPGSAVPTKMPKVLANELIQRISAVEGVSDSEVYDTCPQLVAKIKKFLTRDGMTKANLLRAFGNLNSNSMGRFLSGKKQDQCGNVTYKLAWVFFEKLRILEGKPKSAARLKNEAEQIGGFELVKSRAGKRGGSWGFIVAPSECGPW